MPLFAAVLCFLSLLSNPSAADPNVITVSLTPLAHHPSSNLSDRLTHLATASLNRARHLKTPNRKPNPSAAAKTPLFPRSYGGYSVSLRFGTPPQTADFIMDTGSSLVWLPCSSRYVCSGCDHPSTDNSEFLPYNPKLSSSSKIVGCKNPKCEWVFGRDLLSRCNPKCDSNSINCLRSCPAYMLQYGAGNTTGVLLTESLNFPGKIVPDFLVGCSVSSMEQPYRSGIAGFGRSKESLPSQMGLKKFSYCLLSREFDDTPKSSDLVLDTIGSANTTGMSYTPFRKNPVSGNASYREYYYLTLRRIFVGDRSVKVPYKYLVPGPDGNGGTIVDSGMTLTFMERPVFDAVAGEFEKQMSKYKRDAYTEKKTGLNPCFHVSEDVESVSLPELRFQFKGGAKMALPPENYFSLYEGGVLCFTITSRDLLEGGPAIILGNYQHQNYHIQYDLKNNRFGFKKQTCK